LISCPWENSANSVSALHINNMIIGNVRDVHMRVLRVSLYIQMNNILLE